MGVPIIVHAIVITTNNWIMRRMLRDRMKQVNRKNRVSFDTVGSKNPIDDQSVVILPPA